MSTEPVQPSYGNEPTRQPDMAGAAEARAWKAGRMSRNAPNWRPDYEGTVAQWLVEAPGAHPYWWWYVVSCVHLRDIEGVDPPHIRFPGASHEIMFVALDPAKPLPDITTWEGLATLTPLDLVHQFIVQDDDAAAELTELVVRHICDGNSPDQDFRSYWIGAINRTAEHIRLGGHPDAA